MFCGEVKYISHDAEVHPIKFCWELVDYGAMLEICEPKAAAAAAAAAAGKGKGRAEEAEDEEEDNFRVLLEAAGALS